MHALLSVTLAILFTVATAACTTKEAAYDTTTIELERVRALDSDVVRASGVQPIVDTLARAESAKSTKRGREASGRPTANLPDNARPQRR